MPNVSSVHSFLLSPAHHMALIPTKCIISKELLPIVCNILANNCFSSPQTYQYTTTSLQLQHTHTNSPLPATSILRLLTSWHNLQRNVALFPLAALVKSYFPSVATKALKNFLTTTPMYSTTFLHVHQTSDIQLLPSPTILIYNYCKFSSSTTNWYSTTPLHLHPTGTLLPLFTYSKPGCKCPIALTWKVIIILISLIPVIRSDVKIWFYLHFSILTHTW